MSYDEGRVIEILRSVRHDLLNDLQLLKANAALNRWDRIELTLDNMENKAKNEAKLSNLSAPKFALFLMGYNWKSHPFKIEIEVTVELKEWSSIDDKLFMLTSETFSALEEASDLLTNNVVTVSLFTQEEMDYFSIDYSGKIRNRESLDHYFVKLNQTYHLVEKYIHEEEAGITFSVTDLLR